MARFFLFLLILGAEHNCLAFDRVPFAKSGCVMQEIYVPGENGVSLPVPDRTNQFPRLRASASFEVVVGDDGNVCEVVLKRAAAPDAQQALSKLKYWKFKPAQKDGRSVAVRLTVNLNPQGK